jgi:hypothetical protein
MARFQGIRLSWISFDFQIFAGQRLVTTITMPWYGDVGHFDLGGNKYEMLREGWFSLQYVLKANSVFLVRAKQENFLSRKFKVYIDQRVLTLSPSFLFSSKYCLKENGGLVGKVVPDDLFTRNCTAEFPDNLTLPSQLFLFWLVYRIWRNT